MCVCLMTQDLKDRDFVDAYVSCRMQAVGSCIDRIHPVSGFAETIYVHETQLKCVSASLDLEHSILGEDLDA